MGIEIRDYGTEYRYVCPYCNTEFPVDPSYSLPLSDVPMVDAFILWERHYKETHYGIDVTRHKNRKTDR
jgi:hypothetical protein